MADFRTPRAITMVFIATAVVVVVIVGAWVWPGFLIAQPNCPSHLSQGTRSFCIELVTLTQAARCPPGRACNNTGPNVFTFQGVEFDLSLFNFSGVPGIGGQVMDVNGTWTVSMSGNPLGPTTVNWTSFDGIVFISWHSPFAFVGTDNLMRANVTCGVYVGR
jgi:hypothetical protein